MAIAGNTTVSVGSEIMLTATVLPSNATNKTVTWSATNANVTISGNGNVAVVRGVTAGTTTILARAGDVTAVQTITVESSGSSTETGGEDDNPETTTYIIKFDANGGTGAMANVSSSSASYTLPTKPTGITAPEGKVFAGWAYSKYGAVVSTETIKLKETETTLYAVWKDKPTTPEPGESKKCVSVQEAIRAIGMSGGSGKSLSVSISGTLTSEDLSELAKAIFYNYNMQVFLDLSETSGLTSIDKSFSHRGGLAGITIPSSVTSIEKEAFFGCRGLTSVTIPDSVMSIGECAFDGCDKLTSITIPEGVTSIEYRTFDNCEGLTSVTIPDSVTSIGEEAFSGCTGLTSITIPSSVTSIGRCAFSGCRGLTSITIPEGVTSIGDYAFSGCTGLASITIPSSVTYIDSGTFYGCDKLTSITIPEGVTSISDSAFRNSGLTSITIPSSVTYIGRSTFSGCTGLEKISVSDGNTVYNSMNNCNAIIETSSGTLILGCKNTVIPESVTSIDSNAFRDCTGLTSITIPKGVNIGEDAFSGCSSLSLITIQEGVTSISDSAFRNSGVKNITIPSSVTRIGDHAFEKCSNLANITIPSSVTSIGFCAFSECSNLISVKFELPSYWYSVRGRFYLSESDLANPETAARYLRDTYKDFTWTKE